MKCKLFNFWSKIKWELREKNYHHLNSVPGKFVANLALLPGRTHGQTMTFRSSLMWSTQWYQSYNGIFWFLLSTVLYSQLRALNRTTEVNQLYQKHEYWIYSGILFVATETTNKIPKASSQFITRKHIVINMRVACRRHGRVFDIWVTPVTFNVATLFCILHSSIFDLHTTVWIIAGRSTINVK